MNEFFKKPVVKILMLKGEKGEKGDTGDGLPAGGKTGQYLQKKTDEDYDYRWSDITTVPWDDVTGKPSAYPTTWDNVTGKTEVTESSAGLMSAEDKTKLDNLQVGGRNLYLGTKDFTGSQWLNIGQWKKENDNYNGLTIMSNKVHWYGLSQYITAKTGEVYTISAFVKSTESIYVITSLQGEGLAQTYPSQKELGTYDEFTRIWLTFKVTSGGTIDPRFAVNAGDAGVFKICGIKLERGNMATDWTPAPEDIDSATKSFTLSASSWSSGSYTISDSMITASSNQEILPAIGITTDQMKALQKASIVDAGQSAGSMTLKALGTVPTIDIPIRVIFRGTI